MDGSRCCNGRSQSGLERRAKEVELATAPPRGKVTGAVAAKQALEAESHVCGRFLSGELEGQADGDVAVRPENGGGCLSLHGADVSAVGVNDSARHV